MEKKPSSYDGNDMLGRSDPKEAYAALRLLSVEDPKRARQGFCEMLDGDDPRLVGILELASVPGEGRVRQLVANAVRARPDRSKIVAYLVRWQQTEADEFARNAIDAALVGVDRGGHKAKKRRALVDAALVDTYRYVTGRIRHQMNNALMEPAELIMRLTNRLGRIEDQAIRNELEPMVIELRVALRNVGRIVAFAPEDGFFTVRGVAILDWLANMNLEYGQKYRHVALSLVDQSASGKLHVRANDYLLQTIFWNLWTNAQQAVGAKCEIEVRAKRRGNDVELTVIDNGEGFPQDMREIAFQEKYSSKGVGRGRGLLEVQDAVDRLHGSVQLVDVDGCYRIRIWFPLEES